MRLVRALAIVDQHPAACLSEGFRCSATDAGRPAGYDDGFPREIVLQWLMSLKVPFVQAFMNSGLLMVGPEPVSPPFAIGPSGFNASTNGFASSSVRTSSPLLFASFHRLVQSVSDTFAVGSPPLSVLGVLASSGAGACS